MARIKYQEAIGMEVKPGRPPAGPAPTKYQLIELYVKQSGSVRHVAAALGCSKDMVYRALKECGINRRSKTRISRLYQYDIQLLKAGIEEKGVRGFARSVGVDASTLRYHLKMRSSK
jgi:hypothetical protein